MEKRKIGVKTALPYTEAVAYLKALVKSLESGRIVVESGGEHVALTPGDQVEIEVEAKTGKGRQKFSLEIGWAEMGATDLKISDKEPAPAPKSDAEAAPELAPATAEEKTALPEAQADEGAGKKEEKNKKEKKTKKDKPEKKDKSEKKAKPEKSKSKTDKKAKK
ncbi:amphi-Trp domain-containing protein [Pseudodesulfovibrio sp.]|uniref:amphi-Trp domain-containing protein n=1 Tax=Pseudodesulfovibrio sp. TaxID=2035812 RepID=UPI00260C7E35|nr:amphi-Trp domain-containing protein [Pseudodesulfovibrio sp.]MDD3312138.1 amphi-Trp domain-containing protein [Pseudodesulfovibrio sp.]